MIEATQAEWADLERRYRDVFDTNIPTMELPADWRAARELIELAIATRDDTVFVRDLPDGAVI